MRLRFVNIGPTFWPKLMIFQILAENDDFLFFLAEDVGPMSMNLNLIINKPPPNKVITFQVKTGFTEVKDTV